jgi:hypothetical protein
MTTDHHPIIRTLLASGVEVTLALTESPYAHKCETIVYRVHGFYSRHRDDDYVHLHDHMFFDEETPKTGFKVSYDHETHIVRKVEDLVTLNFAAWRLSCARSVPRTELPPPEAWVDLYEEFELVRKEVITNYVPTSG